MCAKNRSSKFLKWTYIKKYTDHTITRGARVVIKRKNIPTSPIYFVILSQ